jgi:ABC-type multidrug transport system fused ATPase/permease subunit
VRDLRVRLFDHLLTLDFGFFQRTPGPWSRIITEVDQTKTIITASLVSLFQNSVVVIGDLVVLSEIAAEPLFTLAFVPLLVFLLRCWCWLPGSPRPRSAQVTAVTERIGAIRLIGPTASGGRRQFAAGEPVSVGDSDPALLLARNPLTGIFSGFLVILIIWAGSA